MPSKSKTSRTILVNITGPFHYIFRVRTIKSALRMRSPLGEWDAVVMIN